MDFCCKFTVACIHLGFEACIREGLQQIQTFDIKEVGDIYLDIVDAFVAKGRYSDAKPLLKALTESEDFDQVRSSILQLFRLEKVEFVKRVSDIL